MRSLTEQLYDDFFMQELETRLETDTLMVGGLVDSTEVESADCFCTCNCLGYYNNGEQRLDFTTFWARFLKYLCSEYI